MIWPTTTTLLILAAAISAFEAKPGIGVWKTRKSEIAGKLDISQCPKHKYRCDEGRKCIPIRWICDGVSDCDDKRDERNCIPLGKHNNMTKEMLANTLKAVNIATQQDNSQADKISDNYTGDKKECPKGTYACDKDAKCVLLNSLCDKVPDCQDQSDEQNCPLVSAKCGTQRFRCDDGAKCLPLTWLCDSIEDCNDRRDEHNCPARRTGQSLVHAAEEAAINAAKDAKRAALAAQELMTSARQAADKARRALKIAESSRHTSLS